MYIYLNHFTVHLKLTQYCKSNIYFIKNKYMLKCITFFKLAYKLFFNTYQE